MRTRSARKILDYTLMLFLMFLIDLSWCRPSIPFGQETCSPKVIEVKINLKGCKQITFHTVGCSGYCRSDAALDLNSDYGIVSNCDCCKPTSETKVGIAVTCENGKTRNVEMLVARECACTTCRRRFPPMRRSSWHFLNVFFGLKWHFSTRCKKYIFILWNLYFFVVSERFNRRSLCVDWYRFGLTSLHV